MGRRALTAVVLACALWVVGCSDLDTSWHAEERPLPDNHPSKNRIETGKHEWRLVRYAKPGETLPGDLRAGSNDVVWEWRLEMTNLLKKPIGVKAGFGLVENDDTVVIARSHYPPEEEELAIIQPGEKKVFTAMGFIDKKDISRIARGRGMLYDSGRKPARPRKENE